MNLIIYAEPQCERHEAIGAHPEYTYGSSPIALSKSIRTTKIYKIWGTDSLWGPLRIPTQKFRTIH